MSRGTEGAFFLQYVSCLLDIRAELVVTSLTKKYISSCSATGEMVENQLVANDPWYRRDHDNPSRCFVAIFKHCEVFISGWVARL